jgi:microcystin-dependent protein
MTNNKKMANQTGSVPLPVAALAAGSFVSNEQSRLQALGLWPATPVGFISEVGDYIFAISSGTVTAASGLGYELSLGNELSRSSTEPLFNVIGTNYGEGDGVNTYTTPAVWGDYGYLSAATTPSGVTSSGSVPDHTHTVSCQGTVGGVINPGQGGTPWSGGTTISVTAEGSLLRKTNNARHKEVIPMLSTGPFEIPVGSAVQFLLPGSIDNLLPLLPASVLVASGQEISRIGYSVLFERLGVHYGAGDGSTTFNIPDYRGIFFRGPLDLPITQPVAAITGDGFVEADIAAHTHTVFAATGQSATNSTRSQPPDGINMSPPATSTSNFGSADGRPRNLSCLNCIVASGTI